MNIHEISRTGFESIFTCEDKASKLRAVISIHSSRLGPALGGIRVHSYASEEEAIQDAMRLSKAMSYKSAVAHLKLGGGKAVIIGDPAKDKTPALLGAMGKFVNALKGRYYAAKDAGINTEDLVIIRGETEFVTGLPESLGGSGDPSPWTAKGILYGMRACIEEALCQKSFKGLHVAIQGVGHVGHGLAQLLRKEGVELTISDLNSDSQKEVGSELEARVAEPAKIHLVNCHIFAPCALGHAINPGTSAKLNCKIVAGAANNQLKDEKREGETLLRRKILYAPDYILNAGGVINIYVRDILKEKNPEPWIQKIEDSLKTIFSISKKESIPTALVANRLAEQILTTGSSRGHSLRS